MTPELSFDGCGINGPDEYRTPIAKFTTRGDDACRKYGPLFAASPDMHHALTTIADRLEAWAEGESKALEYTDLILDRRAAENRIENYRFMAELARKSLPKS